MNSTAIARNLIVKLIVFGFTLQSLDVRAQETLRLLPPVLSTISDEVGALSVPDGEALAEIVAEVWRVNGVRIIIVIVETTLPENIESYTHRLRAHWQERRPSTDGEEDVFVVIAAKDRTMRIAAGLRMAAIVKEVSSTKLMVDVGPLLRSGKYFSAIVLIVERLLQAIRSASSMKEKSLI